MASVRLTRRESEVFALLAQGNSYKEIARALGIAKSTVKNVVHDAKLKFGAQSTLQLCCWLAQIGVLAVDFTPASPDQAGGAEF